MAPVAITASELLDALAAVCSATGPEEARTVEEIAAQTGVGVKRVRAALHRLKADGRLCVHRVLRPRLDDALVPVSAFTILPAKKKK